MPSATDHASFGPTMVVRSAKVKCMEDTKEPISGGTKRAAISHWCEGLPDLSTLAALHQGSWKGSRQVALSLVGILSFQRIGLLRYQLLWEEQGQGKVAKTVDCPYPSNSFSVPFRQKRPLIQLPLPPQKLATQTDLPSQQILYSKLF